MTGRGEEKRAAPRRSAEDWKRYIAAAIDKYGRGKKHGTVRIIFYEGEVRQVLFEQSVVDPIMELERESGPG